jgi:dimethylhistidine N-methyltransferase
VSTASRPRRLHSGFAADVLAGLSKHTQKELPSKYLYDALGSLLFEAITELPEYGLTRADERLIRLSAGALAERVGPGAIMAELGSGSGRKTRGILEALDRRRTVRYFPIELSRAALEACRRDLREIPSVEVTGIESDYLHGLQQVTAARNGQRMGVLFLGSTIGNFIPPDGGDFLRQVRAQLAPRDVLLLSTDLEQREHRLMRAYDDPLGVTAAFNRNLLVRMNRELDAGFRLDGFHHRVRFHCATRSVEMHLESACEQTVTIGRVDLKVSFRERETIHTESSHKFTLEEIDALARDAGFRVDGQWIDGEWPFAQTLLVAE